MNGLRYLPLAAVAVALPLLLVGCGSGGNYEGPGMTAYPVMVLDFQPGPGDDAAWGYTGSEPPREGEEIVITRSSALPGGDSMSVRVQSVGHETPFPITATPVL